MLAASDAHRVLPCPPTTKTQPPCQVLVNALVELLDSDRLRQVAAAAATSPAEAATAAAAGTDVVLDFVAELLAAVRVVVRPAFGMRLLRHVAGRAQRRAAGGHGAVPSGGGAAASDGALFERLVVAIGVNAGGDGQRYDPDKLSSKVGRN